MNSPGWKGQFSLQFQRKAIPKNVQTTTQLHSSHMLVKYCLKFPKPDFSNMWMVNVQVFNLGLEKAEEPGNIANIQWIIEKAIEFQKNIYFCFFDYAKAFDCVDHNKLWKILKEKGIPDHLTCLLRNLYAGQEVTVRTGHCPSEWVCFPEHVVHLVHGPGNFSLWEDKSHLGLLQGLAARIF